MIAAKIVDHVVHVDSLVDRPRRALLAVGEVGIGQVDLHAGRLAAVPARQAQGMPEVRPEQVVDHRFRHLEPRPSFQLVRPESQRLNPRRGEVQRQEPGPIGFGQGRRSLLHEELAGAMRRQLDVQGQFAAPATGVTAASWPWAAAEVPVVSGGAANLLKAVAAAQAAAAETAGFPVEEAVSAAREVASPWAPAGRAV